ncbi:MAG: SDR family NAD(P)-dependent oxidoreductase [Firmicutes bacterium]|nr:SDR family NAD(P)-dependent oxidoreductase [Bacillota bacterium]
MGLDQYTMHGKVVVVTGSSQGIGKGLAIGLAKEGAKVVVNSRKKEKLEPVVKEIEQTRGEVFPVQADMRRYEDVEDMMQRAAERFGRIDVLINNAGGSFGHTLESLSPNGFDAVVRNNLNQVFYCCKAVRPIMVEQGGGRIINISSVAGLRATPGLGAYGAAKAGVVNLTETMAMEWASDGIFVNCIAPGLIQTEGTEEVLMPTPEIKRQFEEQIPVGRIGVPEDILNACLYLGTEASSYVTGETIKVSGGGTGRF